MPVPRSLRIAIQGERGAFSEEASHQLLGRDLQIVPSRDFPHMFMSVVNRRANACLAPIENSLIGSIFENYDLMLQFGFRIYGEVFLRVRHCLVSSVGTFFEDVRRVYSHPIAIMQCQEFFRRHPKIESVSTYDTAASVQQLLDSDEPGIAAIAGPEAASHYGAKILLERLEDDDANYTRFFLLAPGNAGMEGVGRRFVTDQTGPPKTSIVFYVQNQPGSLHAALHAFASRGVDLTKIESRPVRGKPFEYLFYVDFFGQPDTSPTQEALAELRNRAGFLRVLGAYPSGRLDWLGTDVPMAPFRERSFSAGAPPGVDPRDWIPDRRVGPEDRRVGPGDRRSGLPDRRQKGP